MTRRWTVVCATGAFLVLGSVAATNLLRDDGHLICDVEDQPVDGVVYNTPICR